MSINKQTIELSEDQLNFHETKSTKREFRKSKEGDTF